MAFRTLKETKEQLAIIYRLYVAQRSLRSAIVERELDLTSVAAISDDDKRNEPEAYKVIFHESDGTFMNRLYESLLRGMRDKPIENCNDEFAGLAFLKAVVMKACHLHRADRTIPLAEFARDFDRLDVVDVRLKLYNSAQLFQR